MTGMIFMFEFIFLLILYILSDNNDHLHESVCECIRWEMWSWFLILNLWKFTYIHTYTHTYIHIYIHTYIHTYMHAYIHTYMHACMHHIHTYKHTYIHNTYIHNAYTYLYAYIHACIHTCIHTYMHTYIHTCIYRVSHELRSLLRESVPYVKLYRYIPKHLYPKLNGLGDNGKRKVWTSWGCKHYTVRASWL